MKNTDVLLQPSPYEADEGALIGRDPRDVSAEDWDAAGAAGYGFQTAWVNRAGEPMDRLYAKPHHVLSDLTTIPELA